MTFKKGDRVKFLNDVGQGEIIGFKDSKLAIVINDDGFEMPVLISELLKIDSKYDMDGTNKTILHNDDNSIVEKPKKLEEPEQENLTIDGLLTDKKADVFFAIVPKNQKDIANSDFDLYLINDSNFRILYSVSNRENEFQSLLAYGSLEDNTKFIIGEMKRDDLAKYDEITFQIIFFNKGNYYSINPINKTWQVRPSRFFKATIFSKNDFFHQLAFIYEVTKDEIDMAKHITDESIDKAKKEKEIDQSKKLFQSPKKQENQDIEEVDLHIQMLVDSYINLSNSEIVEIQMARFTTALDGAIIAGTRKMVFIHGVGNGKLKQEIRKTIERKYPKLRYQDASFKEYGYGATMVILK
ncbi:MAG: hypothetical protein A2W99_02480 [Bacteroidetes bacterium GWF2_33_16]|nr:MAG: hypothetical protein A2X00_15675 [Bacteroidetes bacterium GWE2_32_14]OFY07127.1 MAG: hypothetical protein A2W99_02480 [Bacteroidetes bacterium GWF2_33_16]